MRLFIKHKLRGNGVKILIHQKPPLQSKIGNNMLLFYPATFHVRKQFVNRITFEHQKIVKGVDGNCTKITIAIRKRQN